MDKAYNAFPTSLLCTYSGRESAFSTFYIGSGPLAVLLGQILYPYDRSLYALVLWHLPMQPIKLPHICSHLVAYHPNSFPLECGPNYTPVEGEKTLLKA